VKIEAKINIVFLFYHDCTLGKCTSQLSIFLIEGLYRERARYKNNWSGFNAEVYVLIESTDIVHQSKCERKNLVGSPHLKIVYAHQVIIFVVSGLEQQIRLSPLNLNSDLLFFIHKEAIRIPNLNIT